MARPLASTGRSHSMPINAVAPSPAIGRRQSAMQSFGFRRKSEVEIVLDGEDEYIHSYSTFDEIKGHVNVRFEKDTRIDDLHIFFQGQTDTWIETMTTPTPRAGRATARHVFLRMQQPIDAIPFSENSTAKAGVTYSLPFTFVVPDQLLTFICGHKLDNDDVKAQHLLLPPSIGDETIAGEGQVLMNDQAPAMSKVVYSVRVQIVKAAVAGRRPDPVQESVRVRVVPSRPELPPASIEDGPDECVKYRLRKEKNVRKGIFRIGKKQGRLTAETTQPPSLKLPHPRRHNKEPAATMTTVRLRYDPASAEEQPPQLNSIATKLKSFTFFGAGPFKSLPGPNKYDVWSTLHGLYPETTDLSSMNLTSVNWTKHEPGIRTMSDPTPVPVRKSSTTATTDSSVRRALRHLSVGSSSTTSPPNQDRNPFLARRSSTFSTISETSSAGSNSNATDATTLSSPSITSPTTTNNSTADSTILSPSTSYDPSLPYYTTSILVPITLPSHSNSTSEDVTPSSNTDTAPSSGATTTKRRLSAVRQNSSSTSTPTIKRRTNTTFLPTFHSCLISRTYTLDLTISPSGSGAPNITLRTPLQMNLDPPSDQPAQCQRQLQTGIETGEPRDLPAPISFYDPFNNGTDEKQGSHSVNTNTDTSDRDTGSMIDIQNDEAIARALAYTTSYQEGEGEAGGNQRMTFYNSSSITPSGTSNENTSPRSTMMRMDQIPEYSALQIQMNTTATTGNNNNSNNNNENQPPPPEYYSTFRRNSTIPAVSSSSSSSIRPNNNRNSNNNNNNNTATTSTSSTTANANANGNANGTGNERERKSSGRRWSLRS